MIYLGCSGWSYDDWVGVLYPGSGVDKLSYYSSHFNTVEINSTFYSTPGESTVNGWINKVRKVEKFNFTVKLPGELSHDILLHNGSKAASYLDAYQSMILYPLKQAGRLGCVLLQLPPFFTGRHSDHLLEMFHNVDHEGFTYFIEFRNKDFYGNDDVRINLEDENIGIVEIDSPEWHFQPGTSNIDTGYFRFHGNNAEGWKNSKGNRNERYNYLYSREEIEHISSVISKKLDSYKDLYIYFNNHPSGKAVRNSQDLAKSLGLVDQSRQKSLY